MTHIAIQEHLDGRVVEWMEKVSDEQYGDLPSTSTAARGATPMTNEPTAARNPYADIAPASSEQKLRRLARDAKGKARPGTPRETAQQADAVLLAVHWSR